LTDPVVIRISLRRADLGHGRELSLDEISQTPVTDGLTQQPG
jgi:hypothetical protein